MAIENADLRAKSDDLTLLPKDLPGSGDALDALLAAAGAEAGATPEEISAAASAKPGQRNAPAPVTTSVDDAADQAKAAADKEEADKAAAKVEADKVAADKAAADAAAAATTPPVTPQATPPVADPLDAVALPPHTSVKAGEQFAKLKSVAKENQTALQKQIAERDAKIAESAAELEKLRAESGKLPNNAAAELEELRKFKLSHDVESDPSFKEHGTALEANNASIYKKLEQAGYTAENIERIKELGGPDKIEWEPLLAKLNIQTRRFIEAKLVDNVNLADKREEALVAAKANAAGFLQERTAKETSTLINTANSYLKNLPWTAERAIPATATPEQKAELEAANTLARDSIGKLKTYLADRSPARLAELAVGTIIAHKYQADVNSLTAKLTSVNTTHAAALDVVTKERDALKAELAKIKGAAMPGGRGDSKPIAPAIPRGGLDARNGAEALEQYAKEAHEAANMA